MENGASVIENVSPYEYRRTPKLSYRMPKSKNLLKKKLPKFRLGEQGDSRCKSYAAILLIPECHLNERKLEEITVSILFII